MFLYHYDLTKCLVDTLLAISFVRLSHFVSKREHYILEVYTFDVALLTCSTCVCISLATSVVLYLQFRSEVCFAKEKKSHKQTKIISTFGIFFILMFFCSVPNDAVSLLSYMLEFINSFIFVVFMSYLKQLSCHFILTCRIFFFQISHSSFAYISVN